MINNFSEDTSELTPMELKLVKPICNGLRTKVGKNNAVSSTFIIKKMLEHGYPKISDSRIRKIIHYIRVNRLVPMLCASSSGYYVAENHRELAVYVDSLFQRMVSIAEDIKSYRADMPGKVDEIDRALLHKLQYGKLT